MAFFSKKGEKLSSSEVRKKLYRISSLSSSERDEIMRALKPQLDLGGITKQEFEATLKKMRKSKKLSKYDKKRLEKSL